MRPLDAGGAFDYRIPMARLLSRAEFESAAREALDGLPAPFAARVHNLTVLVRERPSPEQAGRHGEGLLGLYEGVPYGSRDSSYSNALPDRITLFRRPIEGHCRTRAEVVELVRETVLHELGHYFGLGERRLRELGY